MSTPSPDTELDRREEYPDALTEILSNLLHFQNDHGEGRGITFDEAHSQIERLIARERIDELERTPLKSLGNRYYKHRIAALQAQADKEEL